LTLSGSDWRAFPNDEQTDSLDSPIQDFGDAASQWGLMNHRCLTVKYLVSLAVSSRKEGITTIKRKLYVFSEFKDSNQSREIRARATSISRIVRRSGRWHPADPVY
jgi:hypothetical protein